MEYNTNRERLPMPEYGREIQNMVNICLGINDRAERQRCANTIIGVMGNMFPQLRDTPEFTHKLWDHLAIMADFKLDIDYPYEIVKQATLKARPERIPYQRERIRYRHYGRLVQQMLEKLTDMEDGEEKDRLIELAANQMKRDLASWNRNSLSDEKIFEDIAAYTHGKIKPDPANVHLITVGNGGTNHEMPNNNTRKRI